MGNPLRDRTLVVQLGERETRVACVAPGQTRPLAIAAIPTPAGAVEDGVLRDRAALTDLLSTLRVRPEFRAAHRVLFVLTSTQVISCQTTEPLLKGRRRLARMLEANADLYFPVDTGKYRLTWQVVGRREGRMQVQLWATPKALLEPYYLLARDCGLRVTAIDYCGHSFAAGIRADFADSARREPEERTTLHLHLEESHILMTFVRAGQVLMQRLLHRSSRPEADLHDLFMELEYFRSEFSGFDRCLVSGAGDLLPGLETLVGVPLTAAPTQAEAMLLGAVGTTLDFGDPSLTPPGSRRPLRGTLAQLVLLGVSAGVLAAVAGLYLGSARSWAADLEGLRTKQLELRLVAMDVEGSAAQYTAYAARYDDYLADREQLLRALRTYNDNACLLLEEVETALPEGASITGAALHPEHMTVDARFPEKEDAAAFLTALRQLRYGELTAVTDLRQGNGRIGPAAADNLWEALELPPAEGGTAAPSATLTESTLRDGLGNLDGAELALLDSRCATAYTAYDLEALLRRATVPQRKAALRGLLREDALALHQLLVLILEDLDRPARERLLTKTVEPDLWEESRGWLARRDAAVLEVQLPGLLSVLTGDSRALSAAEELMATHQSLGRKLANRLAVAMGKEASYICAPDFSQLLADIRAGKTTSDPALQALVEALVPGGFAGEQPDTPAVTTSAEKPTPQPATGGSGAATRPSTGSGGTEKTATTIPVKGYSFTVKLAYREALLCLEQPRKGLETLEDPAERLEVTP